MVVSLGQSHHFSLILGVIWSGGGEGDVCDLGFVSVPIYYGK